MLPFLPSLMPRGYASAAAARPRLIVMYGPNGMHMPAWTPTSTVVDWELSPTLAPLAPYRDRTSVVGGLFLTAADDLEAGFHSRSTASFLTNTTVGRTLRNGSVSNGWSIDQLLAVERESMATLPSVQVGPPLYQGTFDNEAPYPFVYNATVSWRGDTPMLSAWSPWALWRRLTGDRVRALTQTAADRRNAGRASVLDGVLADLSRLQGQAGFEDRPRLEAYVEGVRDLELRLTLQDPEVLDRCAMEDPGMDSGFEYLSNTELMVDLFAHLFVCDATRIGTFMFAAGGMGVLPLGLGHERDHHTNSHHGGDPDRQRELAEINHYEMRQVARLADILALAPAPEGGSVLDHSLILAGAGMSDGDRHDPRDLPLVLVGHAGGAINAGQHLVFPDRTMSDLHLTILAAMGSEQTHVGDSTGVISELLA